MRKRKKKIIIIISERDVNVNLATLTRESSQNIFGILFLVGRERGGRN